jgi:hypothetical protein
MLIVWIVIGTTIWVGVDASTLMKNLTPSERMSVNTSANSPTMWVICCLLLWIVAFPWYIAVRKKYVKLSADKEAATNPNGLPPLLR